VAGDVHPRLQGVDLPRLELQIRELAVTLPARTEQAGAVVGRAAHLVPQRVLELVEAAGHDVVAGDLVDAPAFHPRLQGLGGAGDRAHHGVESAPDALRRFVLALAEHVPGPLEVGHVVVDAQPEIHVDHMPPLHGLVSGPGVRLAMVRNAREHGGAVHLVPGQLEARLPDPLEHELVDLPFRPARPDEAGHRLEDLFRLGHGALDAAHLFGRLTAPQGGNQALRGHQPVRIRCPFQVSHQQQVHSVGQSVGHDVVIGVIDGDGGRIQLGQCLPERIAHPAHVGDHRGVVAPLLDLGCIQAADDGDGPAGPGDDERRGPGVAGAHDQRHARIRRRVRFAAEDQPGVNVQLLHDADCLLDFFTNHLQTRPPLTKISQILCECSFADSSAFLRPRLDCCILSIRHEPPLFGLKPHYL